MLRPAAFVEHCRLWYSKQQPECRMHCTCNTCRPVDGCWHTLLSCSGQWGCQVEVLVLQPQHHHSMMHDMYV